MDRKTRKILTTYKNMHPREEVDRLNCKRLDDRRGLQSVEEMIVIEEVSLEEYLEVKEKIMLKDVKTEKVSRTEENLREKEEFANGRKEKF